MGGGVGALVVDVVVDVVDVDDDVVVDVDSVVGPSVVVLVVELLVSSTFLHGFFQSRGKTQTCLSGEKHVPGAQPIS